MGGGRGNQRSSRGKTGKQSPHRQLNVEKKGGGRKQIDSGSMEDNFGRAGKSGRGIRRQWNCSQRVETRGKIIEVKGGQELIRWRWETRQKKGQGGVRG